MIFRGKFYWSRKYEKSITIESLKRRIEKRRIIKRIENDDLFFIQTFKKHLIKLEELGFDATYRLPKEATDDLVLIYEGSFSIRIERNFRCEVIMLFSPMYPIGFKRWNRMSFQEMVYFFSNGSTNINPLFYGMTRYYQSDYDSKIKLICKTFFDYYPQIHEIMTHPDYPAIIKDIRQRNSVLYREGGGVIGFMDLPSQLLFLPHIHYFIN